MTEFIVVLAACAAGAVLHRMAGGGNSLPIGTQGARFFLWALPMGLLTAALSFLGLSAAPLWLGAATTALLLLGRVDTPHGAGQDLAVPWSTPESAQGMDRIARPERLGYLLAAARARYWLLSLPLVLAVSPRLVLLPLLAYGYPACYLAGLWLEGRGLVFRRFITFRCEWGEALFGGVFAASWAALLMHL